MAQLVLGMNGLNGIPAVYSVPEQKKYTLLQRISDDNGNEIGTVSGYQIGQDNKEYACVCLDAVYRADSLQYLSDNVAITNLPNWSDQRIWDVDEVFFKETATFATDKILAMTTGGTYTSSACTHCRSFSFVIDGITYEGQLPTITELLDIFRHRTRINALDSTASSYTSKVIPYNKTTWSSTQRSTTYAWYIHSYGSVNPNTKNSSYFVVPVIELPLA